MNFNDNSYQLPPWFVTILPDCKNVVLNTAKINSLTTIPKFVRQSSSNAVDASGGFISGWSWFNEPIGVLSSNAVMKPRLLEQINITADKSDYLWYLLSTNVQVDEPFLKDGSQTVLHVESLGLALHAYINGKLAGDVN
ncbi:beta-galactosidase 8-like [Rhododendron vialii]|uniref:beta-galactosidase 8-like n=1 Tax=Rhododendron vialii TaxID=182163 RepID=UPI00265E007F|nr:beta-galactosidase 8-like [Rhododendron vialii]XP_058206297.1 beta-galactosidase 8-like [Rhododendron vialii]XP_058206298.1 beta-galactosidase 8-like [Rhododendron vialii]